jgi:hypothetical protein
MLLLLGVAVLLAFVVLSFRLVRAMSREASIRTEFGLSSSLLFAVLLYPLGAVFMLVAVVLPGPSAASCGLAAAMYVPAFFLARKQERLLEVAGTDRVSRARRTVEHAFGGALCGLLYVLAVSVIFWGASSIRSVGQGA